VSTIQPANPPKIKSKQVLHSVKINPLNEQQLRIALKQYIGERYFKVSAVEGDDRAAWFLCVYDLKGYPEG
jgi:hypothetical protein